MPETTAKKEPTLKYVVLKDDSMGLMFPMTHSTECEGAICSLMPSKDNPIALFNSPVDARKAIRISALNCALRKAQGENVEDQECDFGKEGRKQLYIQPARF